MKREFLQSLTVGDTPLPKEIVDAIMAENGKDIQQGREWEQKYHRAVEEHQAAMDAAEFRHLLAGTVSEAGGRSLKAISALLDTEALQRAENRAQAVKEAVEALKESDGYLFGETPTPAEYARMTGAFTGETQEEPATLAGAIRQRMERK